MTETRMPDPVIAGVIQAPEHLSQSSTIHKGNEMYIEDWCDMEENRAPMELWHWQFCDQNAMSVIKHGPVLKLDGESPEDVLRHICFLANLNRDDFGEVVAGETPDDIDFRADPKSMNGASVYFGWINHDHVIVKEELMQFEIDA